VKRRLGIAQHARRLRNNRRLLWLGHGRRLAGPCLWCGRLLHRWFLVHNHRLRHWHWHWRGLSIQRCLGPPLALHHGLSIRISWFCRLAGFPGLLLWLWGIWIFVLGFWTWFLTGLARCCEPSWRRGRRCISRGWRASSANTNTTCRYADGGVGRALLWRMWGGTQAAWRGCIVGVHDQEHARPAESQTSSRGRREGSIKRREQREKTFR
jgi:hypothetical protein